MKKELWKFLQRYTLALLASALVCSWICICAIANRAGFPVAPNGSRLAGLYRVLPISTGITTAFLLWAYTREFSDLREVRRRGVPAAVLMGVFASGFLIIRVAQLDATPIVDRVDVSGRIMRVSTGVGLTLEVRRYGVSEVRSPPVDMVIKAWPWDAAALACITAAVACAIIVFGSLALHEWGRP